MGLKIIDRMRLNKVLFLLFCFVISAISLHAQSDRALWKEAEKNIMIQDYVEAQKSYQKLYDKYSDNANYAFKLGYCYLHNGVENHLEQAIEYLSIAQQHISENYKDNFKETKAPPATEYFLGVAYRLKSDYKQALEHFKAYKTYDSYELKRINEQVIDREITSCEFSLDNPPEEYQVKSYKFDVDIPEGQYLRCPVISGNDSVFVYTVGNINIYPTDIDFGYPLYDLPLDDIYYSLWKNDRWTQPVNISDDLGVKGNAMPTDLSYDGKTLLLVKDDGDDGNIYMAKFKDGKWQTIKKLNNNINSNKWESHAVMNRDETKMYFTSARKGGFGGLDIYSSTRENKNSDWEEPSILSDAINTDMDEETPFLLEQENQLYFASEKHGNMGGFDMFVSVFDSSRNHWGYPVNLGYPFNTAGNDLAYIVTFKDLFIYCPQNSNKLREGFIGSDCFRLIMPPREKLFTLKGKIFIPQLDNQIPHDLQIMAVNKSTKDTISIIKPENDGSFVIEDIPAKHSLMLAMSSEKIQNKTLDVSVSDTVDRIDQSIELSLEASELALKQKEESIIAQDTSQLAVQDSIQPLEEELATQDEENEMTREQKELVIKPVFFDFDKANIKPQFEKNLDQLASYMKQKPAFELEIYGHTDHIGNAAYNMNLGQKRANAIKHYLKQNGVTGDKIMTKSYGEEQPIAKTIPSDAARKYNRRAEFKISEGYDDVIAASVNVPDKYRHRNTRHMASDVDNDIERHDGNYVIISGSFKNPDNAKKAAEMYEEMGYSCHILHTDNGFNRVSIASFDDKEDAIKQLPDICQHTGVKDAWILSQ